MRDRDHRRCDGCGTPLPGRKMHGFVSAEGRRVTCGRETVQKTIRTPGGAISLVVVDTPECRW